MAPVSTTDVNTFLTTLKEKTTMANASELQTIYTISPTTRRPYVRSLMAASTDSASSESTSSTSYVPLWSKNAPPATIRELNQCICAAVERVSLLQWFWYYFGHDSAEVLHLLLELQMAQKACRELFAIVPAIAAQFCAFTVWCLSGVGMPLDVTVRSWIKERGLHLALVKGEYAKTVQRLLQLDTLYVQRKGCKVNAVDFRIFEQLAAPSVLAEGLTVRVRHFMSVLTLEDILIGRSTPEKLLTTHSTNLFNSLTDAAILLGDDIVKALTSLAQVCYALSFTLQLTNVYAAPRRPR